MPYKGEGPANTDVAGGQVDIAFSSLASVAPLVKSGRLVALGISTPERSAVLPDVPTIAPAGAADFQAVGWYGLLAPAGTPAEDVAQLSDAVAAVLDQPAILPTPEALCVNSRATPAAAFARHIDAET